MEKKFNSFLFSIIFFVSKLFVPPPPPTMAAAAAKKNNTVAINVGVVLDMDIFGQVALSCISMALLDFYVSHDHYKTQVVLNVRDSKEDVLVAALQFKEIGYDGRQNLWIDIARRTT
ncbi:OLC1v1030572C1 [Oldenlandia corymbosa var. corymbosa]|uniref:OLC1v1030572C1 n=1 Tax=Oldenlandia corymbosa var. corymbosa TaxID=529605 RepID=A0AAV1CI88_OLDCO|nr:OLC1v1030572C1 [Oldenlandia corymbosa var. corymbosa]